MHDKDKGRTTGRGFAAFGAGAGGCADPDLTGMQVALMSDDGSLRIQWISEPPEGTYQLGTPGMPLYIEAKDGKWYARCVRPAYFQLSSSRVSAVPLPDSGLIPLIGNGQKCILYTENTNSQSSVFHNYFVEKDAEITIGRLPSNDVVYPNRFVSKTHATLKWEGKRWLIRDCNSTNGVFVNDRKVATAELHVGDSVFILGLRILIGAGFISINDGNNRAQITSRKLRLAETLEKPLGGHRPSGDAAVDQRFNRIPRHRTALSPKDIEIEGPPMSLNSNQIPLLLRMGGSMVMSGTSALAGHFTPLLTSLLFPLMTQKYTDKEKKEYETRRVEKYRAYLKQKEAEIQTEREREQRILNQNFVPLDRLFTERLDKTQLWGRRKVDDDFLQLRVGRGRLPLLAEISYPNRRFGMDEDPLEEQMFRLAETPVFLEDVPIVLSLLEHHVCGVKGSRQLTLAFLQRLLQQAVFLHSYDEMKLVLLADPKDLDKLEYVKYLPHVWDNGKTIRFVATNPAEAYQISEYLRAEIGEDLERPHALHDILKARPYYVVFALSKRILDSMEVLKDVMQQEENCGVCVIAAFEDVPKDCSILFELDGALKGQHRAVYLNQLEREDDLFQLDTYNPAWARQAMKQIANTSLKLGAQAYELPKTVTFLDMYGVGRLRQLQLLKRWRENDPSKSLAVPVGVATDGSAFTLDLHEKFQGPHGLVAGMTGSGKSEFLLTYILSMAVNFRPDEVAFVLIDYKGGGLAGAFVDESRGVHLPHVVGTITNLDGAAIQRSLISLQSEVQRRQRVFNRAKSAVNEGTMDIYAYQRLYRRHLVEEPMPHLFIVSDEFAELKQQEPEFMDQLISIARIGRSLGVHLILATQKPAGVVNDQIWSNSKFKVCLKVQDRSDSMDMLKRPEAAELRETGRFYLQVGYNEFFALGQSGWCGAPYEPQETMVRKTDNSVQFIDLVGQNLYTAQPQEKRKGSGRSQLAAAVEAVSKAAASMGIVSHALWKPELTRKLDLDAVEGLNARENNGAGVSVTVGLLDDPEQQRQFPLTLELQNSRHLLIAGDAGSGKTTLIQTILLSLARRYSPEQVNFYLVDYSSRMLTAFRALPHCGGVLCEDDAASIDRFFELINGIVARRKQLFFELEVGSYEAANKIRPMPLIVVVIDNLAGFTATDQGQKCSYLLGDWMRNAANYGVKYIISCAHMNEVMLRTRQELGERISLHQSDRYEYGEVLDTRCEYLPPDCPGRGLALWESRPLELQAALYRPDLDDAERVQAVKGLLQTVAAENQGFRPAQRLPVISETETYAEFADRFQTGRIPLGYSLSDAKQIALPLKQLSPLALYFGNPMGIAPVLENFLYAAKRERADLIVVRRQKGSLFRADGADSLNWLLDTSDEIVDTTERALSKMWHDLLERLKGRSALLQDYCAKHGIRMKERDAYKRTFAYMTQQTTPLLILFESFSDVCLEVDEATTQFLSAIFQQARLFNLYVIGCFYPEQTPVYPVHDLFQALTREELVMLFGGRMLGHELCQLPGEYTENDNVGTYNRCLMKYRDGYYPLLMPCGQLQTEQEDEDDRPIFSVG